MKSSNRKRIVECVLIIIILIMVTFFATRKNWLGNYKLIESDTNHYLNDDDPGITNLIEEWSKNGLIALYGDEKAYNNVDPYYDRMVNYIIKDENGKNNSFKEKLVNFLTGTHIYTQEEVEKALNTLIYGSSSGKDTYDSIMEMPIDLYRICTFQIDFFKGANLADIVDEVQAHRSDYVASDKSKDKQNEN